MAEKETGGGKNEFGFFIFFILILILAWVFTQTRDKGFSLFPISATSSPLHAGSGPSAGANQKHAPTFNP